MTEIPELQCCLREIIHEPTGAQIMHIGNDDPENLFCLSFQTLPCSSNGVAHILEHTVLCGSEKFPVKDPFFAMSRRSLNTFMNALTGADFTCYPAASQVHKDFYNLLEVYLDAVFHPTLSEFSFAQEGHRLEFTDLNDSSSPLLIKGIVYNEMKGALSSSSARLIEAINAALFPAITYGYNSGGDPKDIPKLSYEELKQFHQTYYHPSRCLFFFYGNIPLESHLDFIAKETLDRANALPSLPPVPLQPRFKKPIYLELTYPIAPEEEINDKTLISFSWLTCHILEQQEAMALGVLEMILMDTDASPLKIALLQSGLCKQAQSSIDEEITEIPWTIVLKGCQRESADDLEKVIRETLERICKEGIPIEKIENALHQLEFYRSEITGDHAPFGLSLFMRSALLKQHGADPAEGLRIHSLFDRLRQATIADANYFCHLIDKHLISNSHFVRIVMRPDPHQCERELSKEKAHLAALKEGLNDNQRNAVVKRANELIDFQKKQEEEDIEVLPKVSLNDVPLKAKNYLLSQEQAGNLTLFHQDIFTNKIVYADLIFNLPDLSEDDLVYLRLLTVVLTQMGCAERSYQKNLEYLQGSTGGIGAGINLNLQASDSRRYFPTFHLRGKALYHKTKDLFTLLHETAHLARLDDVKRLKELLLKHFSGMESQISQSALKYAINMSAGALNSASKMANELYGLNYFWKIRELVTHFDEKADHILIKLQEMYQRVSCLERPHLLISCDKKMLEQIKRNECYGLQDIHTHSYKPWKGEFSTHALPSQGRIIASQVAFIGKVFPSVSYNDTDAPALNIASALFDKLTLHTKIREQGGAYGGGAVSNPLSGNFYFYSYRDPNVISTFKAFNESVETVVMGEFDEIDIEEAKFEIIQGLDSPVSPGSQAEIAYGWMREGRTIEIRQAFRDKLLRLNKIEIVQAVEKNIVPNMQFGGEVVFAAKEQLESANQQLESEGKLPLLIEAI